MLISWNIPLIILLLLLAMTGLFTALRHARRLRESEERNRLILDTAMDAVISADQVGRVVGWNKEAARMFGYSADQALGRCLSELIVPPLHREAHRQGMQRFVNTGKATIIGRRVEITGMRADGSEFPIELTIAATLHQGHYLFNAFVRDITECRLTEEKLRVAQQHEREALDELRLVFDISGEGFLQVDATGHIVEVNAAYCRMIGYPREEIVGAHISRFEALEQDAEVVAAHIQLIIERGCDRFETKHLHRDGHLIDLEVSAVYVKGKNQVTAFLHDVGERKRMEDRLQQSETRFRAIIEQSPIAVAFSRDGLTIDANAVYLHMFGYDSIAELREQPLVNQIAPQCRDAIEDRIRRRIQGESLETTYETIGLRKDGSQFPLLVSAKRVVLPDGPLTFTYLIDITERRQAEEAMRIAAATFETQEAILITDPEAKILRVNNAFQAITGYRAEEVVGHNPRMLQSGQHDAAFYLAMWSALLNTGKWSGEVWDRRKNGEIYPKSMTITAVYDDQHRVTHYVAVFRDISNRKKSEQEIHQLAFFDPLTLLPNRRLFQDRLRQAMATSLRNARYGALLFLDLDHFKTINDTQGHAVGDLLLIEVAHRLQTCVRDGDSVARLGGDEFVVLLEELSIQTDEAATQAELVAEKIRSELNQPYVLNDYACRSTPSIGISLFRGQQDSMEDLLRHADVAMYQAKTAGRNVIRFFDPQMQMALDLRTAMEADMRRALDGRQFILHYQVQVDCRAQAIGAEVLLRWQHPERGFVFPDQFIPLAEETGLIVPIGLWVLQTACAQLKVWQKNALTRDLTLAVNVSAKQFRQADFVSLVQRTLLESGAKPSQLKLELTESTVLENVDDTIARMREIKMLGVDFSMDDFGTGYSSLQYLKRLPLDQIKIDKSFVNDITTDPNDAAIVQTIIAMTQAMGLNVIAEGVETQAQRDFLDEHGCHAFQGYLFSKPVPIEQFEALLDKLT